MFCQHVDIGPLLLATATTVMRKNNQASGKMKQMGHRAICWDITFDGIVRRLSKYLGNVDLTIVRAMNELYGAQFSAADDTQLTAWYKATLVRPQFSTLVNLRNTYGLILTALTMPILPGMSLPQGNKSCQSSHHYKAFCPWQLAPMEVQLTFDSTKE